MERLCALAKLDLKIYFQVLSIFDNGLLLCYAQKYPQLIDLCTEITSQTLFGGYGPDKVYNIGFLSLEHQKTHVFLCFSAIPSILTQDSQIWLFQTNRMTQIGVLSPFFSLFKGGSRVGHSLAQDLSLRLEEQFFATLILGRLP